MFHIYSGFLVVGDVHLASHKKAPTGRLDENYLLTVTNKLKKIKEIAKELELKVIFLGQLFKSKFDIEALTAFIDIFHDVKPYILVGDDKGIDKNSTLGILMATNTAEVIDEAGISTKITIEMEDEVSEVGIYLQTESNALPRQIGFSEGLALDEKAMIFSPSWQDYENDIEGSIGLICSKWSSVAVSKENSFKAYAQPLVRTTQKENGNSVSVLKWTDLGGFEKISIDSQSYIFDNNEVVMNEPLQHSTSDFAKELKEASAINNTSDPDVLAKIIQSVADEKSVSLNGREIIWGLLSDIKAA